MPIGIGSIDGVFRSLVEGAYPNFGQTIFVVDSDYRTVAQGWSRTDRTGPLDLLAARHAGSGGQQYVFRTGDYSADEVAIQAAHDAAIAFRGDALFFTPGAYSLAAVVNVTTESVRFLGPAVNYPKQARATITAAVDAGLSIAATADDMELAFLKLVPLADSTFADVTGAANRGYWHHFTCDMNGVAAANTTGAGLVNFLGAALDWKFSDFYIMSDAAQTAAFTLTGNVVRLGLNNWVHHHAGGTSAVGLLEVDSTASYGHDIGPGLALAAGATAFVTTLGDVADQATNTVNSYWHDILLSGYASVSTMITGAGATGEHQLTNCRFGTVKAAATTTALMHTGSLVTG